MECDRCGDKLNKPRGNVKAAVVCFNCWDEIRDFENKISLRDGVIAEQEKKIAGLEARIRRFLV